MGDDASSSEDKEDRGIVVTLVEHHKPAVVPVDGERGTEVHGDVPKSRKCAMSEDTTLEREAKRAWSSRPLEASSASRTPAPSVVEHAGRSGGHDSSPTSSGSTCVHDPQWGDAPPVALVILPQAGGRGHS